MGISPSEMRVMSWWEYQALLWNWNDRHAPAEGEEEVEAPDPEFVMRRQARLERLGLAKVLN